MTATGRAHALLLIGPAALLAGALAFQHVVGLQPCEMCHWQRWALLGALAPALMALAAPGALRRVLLGLAAGAALASGAIALWHMGVERQWWPSPTPCAAPPTLGQGPGGFADAMLGAAIVRCDAVPWSLAGLSMAGWNMVISTLIAGGAFAWLRTRR
jgi:disulfide bond formation protein DsbB